MVFNVYEDTYDDTMTDYGFYVKMGDHGKGMVVHVYFICWL